MASDVSNDASLGSGHGFTLAQLEKFAEMVARTRSTSAHTLGDDGAWVETQGPSPGVVVVRLFAGYFSWAHIELCGGRALSLWNDFPGQECVAMGAAWDRARAQAAAEAMAPKGHGLTLKQLEGFAAVDGFGDTYHGILHHGEHGAVWLRSDPMADGAVAYRWGRASVSDGRVRTWHDFSDEEQEQMRRKRWERDVVESEVKPVDEGTDRLRGGIRGVAGLRVAGQVAETLERGWQLAIQNGHTIQTAHAARPHTEAAPTTTWAPVAQSGPLTIRGRHGPVDDELVAKLAEAEFLRRELATPPEGLTLERWHAFLAHRSEHACGGHYDRRGPEGMTAAAVNALRSDVESGRATVPKRILGNDTQLRHRERSTKPKREWWK